jgi:hypothetical protein
MSRNVWNSIENVYFPATNNPLYIVEYMQHNLTLIPTGVTTYGSQ